MITAITDETFYLEKGYYNGIHILLQFKKEDGADRNEGQADMDADLDE